MTSAEKKNAICSVKLCCTMTASNGCNLDTLQSMIIEENTKNATADITDVLVFPGGDTECLLETSAPFSFQVFPGSSSKLLLSFQGGGLCFNEMTTVEFTMCTPDAIPSRTEGVYDTLDSRNPYQDYTIVNSLYCSGDFFIGNLSVTYDSDDRKDVQVTQSGVTNVESVISWIESQQNDGHIKSEVDDLVVLGYSAGGVAAQMWSPVLVNQFKHQTAAVISDSFMGIVPPGENK